MWYFYKKKTFWKLTYFLENIIIETNGALQNFSFFTILIYRLFKKIFYETILSSLFIIQYTQIVTRLSNY